MRIFTIKNISSSPLAITAKGVNGYTGSVHYLTPEQEIDLLYYEISIDIDSKVRKNLISKAEKANIKTISYFSDNSSSLEKTEDTKEEVKQEETTAVKRKRKKGTYNHKQEV
jgi:hypothetical protein